jgi:hypothetical protein
MRNLFFSRNKVLRAPLRPLEIQFPGNCYTHMERCTMRPQDLHLLHTEDVHKYHYVNARL